jgi:hypothetical protein
MRTLIIAALALCAPLAYGLGCDGSGNCYIYASASGTGTGASWTNAYTGFGTGTHQVNPASMTRGVTYWIAAGSYGTVAFSTAASGTAVITLEAATTGNHGPASDWSNSYAGQAVFGESTFTTAYWTVDGQTRGSDWQSSYSIKFWNQSDGLGAAIGISATNLTFEYIEVEGTGAGFPNNNSTADKCTTDGCGVWQDEGIDNGQAAAIGSTNYLYVGYSYVHNTGNNPFHVNAWTDDYFTMEYNWIAYNHTGQNGGHSEACSCSYSDLVIRYNVFQDICDSGEITDANGGSYNLSNWDVYGNLFFWDNAYNSLDGSYGSATIDTGILGFYGETFSGYIHFYNNTIANMNPPGVTGYSAFATQVTGGYGGSGVNLGSPTVTAYNNLWWNTAYVAGDYPTLCNPTGGNPNATCIEDYETYYNGTVPSGQFFYAGTTPPGTHSNYVTSTTVNPFVNYSAFTLVGFQLTTPDPFASNAGTTLASPYNFDGFNQVTRGANGTWDRGAEQLGSSGGSGGSSASGNVVRTGTVVVN